MSTPDVIDVRQHNPTSIMSTNMNTSNNHMNHEDMNNTENDRW